MVQINVDKTPNPIKAMMVEYAGELPKDGEYMQITAGGAQYEIKESYLSQWNTLTDHKYSIVECKPTKVLLQPDLCTVRLVQRQDNLNLIAVNEICFDLIDDSKREDEEVAPVGPFIRAVDNAIQWESPIGQVMFYKINLGDNEKHTQYKYIADLLSNVDLNDDKLGRDTVETP